MPACATPWRAASSGFDYGDPQAAFAGVHEELAELEQAQSRAEVFAELGDLLFATVNVARKLRIDPELALRAASDRFRDRVERGSALATSEGHDWNDLQPDEQLAYYARARLTEGGDEIT